MIGNPNLRPQSRLGPLEHGGRHAHNGVRVLIDFDGMAHDVRVRGEVRLPEPVADHGDGSATRLLVIGGQETASQGGLYAENGEIVRGGHRAPDAFRLVTIAGRAAGELSATVPLAAIPAKLRCPSRMATKSG